VPTYHNKLDPGFWGGESSEGAINWKEEDETTWTNQKQMENFVMKKKS